MSLINFERFSGEIASAEKFFSKDYIEARERWVKAVEVAGGKIESIPLPSSSKIPLTLEFAWFGDRNAPKVLLHIAGTHGIEGFLGSAIQLAAISNLGEIPSNTALVFLHCLNPWGMMNLRRVNEDNVDLNRNFCAENFSWSGSPEVYSALDSFLNPKRKPRCIDGFIFGIIGAILKFGFNAAKQAIAGGQYDFPKGTHFGGNKETANIALLKTWVKKELSKREKVSVIEIHSGLGPFGYDTLFAYLPSQEVESMTKALNHPLSVDDPDESVGFKTAGDIAQGIQSILGQAKCPWILQEFGTYNIIKVYKTLRNENMHYHYGGGSLDHWSKRALLESFNPASSRWRRYVIGRGLQLLGTLPI